MTTAVTPDLVQTLQGTWDIDPSHSEIAFVIRHLTIAKVRGQFGEYSGSFVVGDDLASSGVEADIVMASINTANADRDAHVRSDEFLDVEQFPTMRYRSTGIRPDGEDYVVDGELTLHGVTRPVTLQLEVNGYVPESPFGDSRVGFSASTEIDRRDFDLHWHGLGEAGGALLSHKVKIQLEVEAVKRVEG